MTHVIQSLLQRGRPSEHFFLNHLGGKVDVGTTTEFQEEECSANANKFESKSGECDVISKSFPTEQSIRQHVAKKTQKEALERQGRSKEEIKKIMGKKPQPQEQIFEDCGSGFTPLELDESKKSVLACSFNVFDDVFEYCFGENSRHDNLGETLRAQFLDDNFPLRLLFGREAVREKNGLTTGTIDLGNDILHSYQVNGRDAAKSFLDLLEFFAGERGVT